MAWIGKVFGTSGRQKNPMPTPQEAIQKLRETEEMLIKKQEFLEKKIGQEVATAKKHGTKNKRLALHALKRKKQYENQLAKIDGTLSTIEFQREALENAATNTEVMSVMGTAAKAMKQAHNHMDVDQVHDLMDDISEQQQIAEEMTNAISNPMGLGIDVPEDELLAELEALEQAELDERMIAVEPAPSVKLPEVPAGSLRPEGAKAAKGKRKDDEERELRELEAWAN